MKTEIIKKEKNRIEEIMWYIEKDSIVKHKDLIKYIEDGKYKMPKITMEETLKEFYGKRYFIKIKTEKNVYYISYADMMSDIINKKNVNNYLQDEIKKTIDIINKIKILLTNEVHLGREWTKIYETNLDLQWNQVSLKYESVEKETTNMIDVELRFEKREDQEAYKKELRELYIKCKYNINKLCEYVKENHSVKPTTKTRLKLRRQIFNEIKKNQKIINEIIKSQQEHCPWCSKLLYKTWLEKNYLYVQPDRTCKKCKKTYLIKTRWG